MDKPYNWDAKGQLFILAVDDDEVNLMVIEQLLQNEDFLIMTASTGAECYDLVEKSDTSPDIFFIDYYLNNGETGEEVCGNLRSMYGMEQVPLILCTALSDGAVAVQNALKKGATDYLLKPYERGKLMTKLEKHVAHKMVRRLPPPGQHDGGCTDSSCSDATAGSGSHAFAAGEDIVEFCKKLGLEYCGLKLCANGVTMEELMAMDDLRLRKAGVVVKAQRNKILEAVIQQLC